jgi:signal transduction histidine kinase
LRKRLEAVEGRSGIQTSLEVKSLVSLQPAQEEHLFWIAVEALNNSLHHAAASHVVMQISMEEKQCVFSISDNGKGFDLKAAHQGGGMGLNNMHQRAAKIGAALDIRSNIGSGTVITLRLNT